MMGTNRALATLVLLALVSTTSACSGEDLEALLSVKASFPPDSFPASWDPNNTPDCCTWDYVTCGGGGRVTMLKITKNDRLIGPIPPSIGDLSSLTSLFLTGLPNLVGPIPSQLGMLVNLGDLRISETGVSGPVPSFLSDLTRLYLLSMNNNNLTGPIPASLGGYASNIYLAGNRLTGAIPSTLFSGNNARQITLVVSDNELTGEVPPSLGDYDFYQLDLSGNRLTGDPSFLFGNPINQLSLARNRFAFDLTHVAHYSPQLSRLDLSHNEIHGRIPEHINGAEFYSFDVSHNRLCGRIPNGNLLDRFGSSPAFDHNACLWSCTPAPLQTDDFCRYL